MNIARMKWEFAQAAGWLAVQAGETHETVKTMTFLDRGKTYAIWVNGRVVGEVSKLLLAAEPPPKPGVN